MLQYDIAGREVYCPSAHVEQLAAPMGAYCPGGQSLQNVSPLPLYLPPGQLAHVPALETQPVLNLPAAHIAHGWHVPALLYSEAAHEEHMPALSCPQLTSVCPEGHGLF